MRRYDARDITEHHYRALRLLLTLNMAEAHNRGQEQAAVAASRVLVTATTGNSNFR